MTVKKAAKSSKVEPVEFIEPTQPDPIEYSDTELYDFGGVQPEADFNAPEVNPKNPGGTSA